MSNLVERAASFASLHHKGQSRKYTGEPYITHPQAVVGIVSTIPHTEEMLAAAWLHDTVEDTPATIESIKYHFGDKVAEYVGFLTDVSKPNDGNRKVRKALDRVHISNAPAEVQTIKLADLIHNTESIIAHDPKFAKVYLVEARLLIEVLEYGDSALIEILNKKLKELVK